jgi:hypothetical protein
MVAIEVQIFAEQGVNIVLTNLVGGQFRQDPAYRAGSDPGGARDTSDAAILGLPPPE